MTDLALDKAVDPHRLSFIRKKRRTRQQFFYLRPTSGPSALPVRQASPGREGSQWTEVEAGCDGTASSSRRLLAMSVWFSASAACVSLELPLLTGVALGGIYPPGMRLAADSW
jgi:hypothetical protein